MKSARLACIIFSIILLYDDTALGNMFRISSGLGGR
jgi:hypothetical protein